MYVLRILGLVGTLLASAGVSFANETTSAPTSPPATPASPGSPPIARPVAQTVASTVDEPPAPEPVDTRLFVDAMLGLGSEQLNLGIGARGGKTFENHVYVGGLFVYHLGTSSTTTVGGTMVTASASGFYIGPEIGYDIPLLTSVVLRPYIGAGLADASVSSASGSASSSELSIWPGVAAHYLLAGSKYVVGGDLRIVTGPWGTSLGLFVLGGTHFGS